MKLHYLAAAAVLAAAVAAFAMPARAQFAKPEEAVRYRQGSWFLLNHHFNRIGAMARGRVAFDGAAAVRDADMVASLARLPFPAFVPQATGGNARPEIWTEQARFREHNDKMLVATTKLAAAARTHNLDQIKAAYGAAANTCKECHDAYRSH